ncbi:hypothetical protein [Streptomyces sp. NPDC058632]|uniref:hypothetical protein n=1 Tax=unclassified Streptomyces TaxID=2593676 RepID=UPI00365BEE9F
MAADDRTSEIRRLLLGATVHSVGRAADMGVVEFAARHDEVINAHLQCPFRIVQEGKLLIGSRDMRYAQRGAGAEAFDRFETVYDSRAATLNGVLERLRPVVGEVALGDAGSVTVEWQPGFRLEVFPDCSGSVESWRVFVRGGRHVGFPEGVV